MQQASMQHLPLQERTSRPAPVRTTAGRRTPTVVLADDSIFQRMMTRAMLEAEGYHVLEAADGREVLDLVRLSHPDLIVMDIAMPSMDGVTTARRLRTGLARVPIVFLSALAGSGDRDTALAAGGDEYLVKPVSNRELLAVVRRYAGTPGESDQ
ncbi:MAG TPA: response regulator [Gemmatimonadaceae bacterium]|nr:response regulator [Gemmatimonadaceae bacterium]